MKFPMRRIAAACAAVLFLVPGILAAQQAEFSGLRIRSVDFRYLHRRLPPARTDSLQALVNLKAGASYNARLVREAMDHLFRMGRFADIIVQVQRLPRNEVNLTFQLERRLRIQAVRFEHDLGLKTGRLRQAVFSLRRGAFLSMEDLKKAEAELRSHLESQGYFSPRISYHVQRNLEAAQAAVLFRVEAGRITRVENLKVVMSRPRLRKRFTAILSSRRYIPSRFRKGIGEIRSILKQQRYYFPEIDVREDFPGQAKSTVRLTVTIDPGARYEFHFLGMRRRLDLIESIWANKVFEKWAETESRARILRHLKNRGYLDARVESRIHNAGGVKTITFSVDRRRRYALGRITIDGNHAIPEADLRRVIKTDDQIFDRLFYLRLHSLQVDLEVLKLYYYFHGFPQVVVQMIPEMGRRRANIHFRIREGRQVMVDALTLRGNRNLPQKEVLGLFQTRTGAPFVPQRFSEDIQRVIQHYQSRGYADVRVTDEVSPGARKTILVTIEEGPAFRTGDLIIIGASRAQRAMIRSLFPLQRGGPFNGNRLQSFKTELENSASFNDIVIEEIRKTPGVIDVMIKATPDYSRYYGFGLGWEDRRGYRGTLEFQQQNFLYSYSAFSALLQLGPKERRGVISVDTPYFLHSRLSSSLRLWQEDQVYPSYKYLRTGISQSIIHRIAQSAYISASLKWYRTRLTELDITPQGLDRLEVPFDTTAFSLLYVNDQRDNPFNPEKGDFFSSNIIIGFPLLEKEYSFFKFFWSYQKNLPLMRHGTLSFSVRNGFSAGDMSITERFFAGGIHTFRGAGNDRLGPIDALTGEPRGGNAMLLFNLEASLPFFLVPVEGLQYTLFADMGNIFPKASDFSLKRLETAVGFGIKYITPLGPIRVDFAWNLRGRKADNPFLVKIGIGNVF